MTIDTDNQQFKDALNIIQFTNNSLFITGKAGTGKSTFLRYICEKTPKEKVVLAPTGIAAINVGGATLHSFFKLPFYPLTPEDANFSSPKRLKTFLKYSSEHIKLIKKIEMVIIDEISMVRADIIDFIDKVLRVYSGHMRQPFGGKQMVFVGDVFQLEPVVTRDEKDILNRFYPTPFFFDAHIFKQMPMVTIELTKVYRQSDNAFISLLDHIRSNNVGNADLQLLNMQVGTSIDKKEEDFTITLATRRDVVDAINQKNLDDIERPDAQPVAVIIKQAVATGWDCPRAHILVKLRDNMSETFEIQTIGRIRRMPEAHHYDSDLLDCCYLYTLDEKFTEGVQTTMGNGALNAVKLYLKKEFKTFSLTGERKPGLSETPRDSYSALNAIAHYFQQTYKLDKDYRENRTRLETAGYNFSADIVKHTVSGDLRKLSQEEIAKLNDIAIREPLNTHRHGRDFHHELSNIALKISLQYDQMNLIARRLFGKKDKYDKKLLNLEPRQLYAFVLNNSDRLRHDVQEAIASNDMGNLPMPIDNISEYTFRIPQETIFTYNATAKDQSVMTKSVYGGYVASAEPRSDSERSFEKYCEANKNVKWFYKNGDKGSEYFSIVYADNTGKLKSFFPDYIIGLQNGETWIIETKGGFDRSGRSEDIDIFSPKKFEVLKAYLQKHNLKGGFVRKDKQSGELCICTEHFSNDIQSADWQMLKDVL